MPMESAAGAEVPPFVYQDFETSPGFSAAGDAAVEQVESDAKHGRAYLKVRFGGIKDDTRMSLIQAPTMPKLGHKVREAEATGIRFWVRGDGPRRRVQFRIQWRDWFRSKSTLLDRCWRPKKGPLKKRLYPPPEGRTGTMAESTVFVHHQRNVS
jgi:hypothetical protein